MKYILTLIYIIFTTCALFVMKAGGDTLLLSFKNGITFKIGFLTLLGFVLYLISFLLWQKLLVTFDLSYIVPITTGICQCTVFIGGVLLFKETIAPINILGILLTIVGIVLIGFHR